jgi:Legume lectin domain
MHVAKLSKLPILVAALLLVTVAAAQQQIRFENFSSVQHLDLNGKAHQATLNGVPVLRLTDGLRMNNQTYSSSVWFDTQQPLTVGFTTYFAFQIHNPAAPSTPGDGFAFVIQNSPATDYCGSGSGTTALGVPAGGMGYTGIENSLAVELDTTKDAWDPNGNHIAVQSCGTQANSSAHIPGSYPICGGKYTINSCLVGDDIDSGDDLPPLGVLCGQNGCQDGAVHQVVVEYIGAANDSPGNISIFVDPPFIPGTHTPAPNAVPQINRPLTVEQVLSLNNNSAYVGFTASQASESQTTDLLAWEFSSRIQEKIQGGGNQTMFNYGPHFYGVTYPMDFNNPDGDFMTVDAIPIEKQTFFLTRLQGTQFSNEQCLTYEGIGGYCIIYEVTCQASDKMTQIPCPDPDDNQFIDVLTSYMTTDNVNAQNADFIKAPIGTNNWCSIFTGFVQDQSDPTTSGKGKDFSDFVATFKPHGGTDPQCSSSNVHQLK